MQRRTGPFGLALPNVEGHPSFRIAGLFGTGYGVFGLPGVNPLQIIGQFNSGNQEGKMNPAPVNQGFQPPAPTMPKSILNSVEKPTLAALRLQGKRL